MRIKHYAWQEVDGVERSVVIDGRTNSWVKHINGCTMTWFKQDGWEEVVETKFVDAMRDVVVSIEGDLRLCHNGRDRTTILHDPWRFEKIAMYDLPFHSDDWPIHFPPWGWLAKFRRECIIVKKKVNGS